MKQLKSQTAQTEEDTEGPRVLQVATHVFVVSNFIELLISTAHLSRLTVCLPDPLNLDPHATCQFCFGRAPVKI